MSKYSDEMVQIAEAIYKQLEDVGYIENASWKEGALQIILDQIDGRYSIAAFRDEIRELRKEMRELKEDIKKALINLKTGATL